MPGVARGVAALSLVALVVVPVGAGTMPALTESNGTGEGSPPLDPSAAPLNEPPHPHWGQDRGFAITLAFQTSVIGAEDPPDSGRAGPLYVDEVGAGIRLGLGYAFGPTFALRLTIAGSQHETTIDGVEALYSTGMLEAQYRFMAGHRARPYLSGGLGGAVMEFDTDGIDSRVRGGMASVGAGVVVSLTEHLVIDVDARLDLINWDRVEVELELPGATLEVEDPVDEDGSAGRFGLGLAWEF